MNRVLDFDQFGHHNAMVSIPNATELHQAAALFTSPVRTHPESLADRNSGFTTLEVPSKEFFPLLHDAGSG